MTTEKVSLCPHCGGVVIKRSYAVPNRPPELMVDGPGGEDNYRTEVDYHCESCQTMFFDTPKEER